MKREEIAGKRVIEVGSCDVNGSLRPLLESWKPLEYIGVDIQKGHGVDMICRVEELIKKFGKESFDVVISTELLEHVRDWRAAISNIKDICRRDGIILLTTRAYGAVYHAFPYDFWRYEVEDMRSIFSDCKILILEKDYEIPGVLVKVRKPKEFVENDLSGYELYSIVAGRRVSDITDKDFRSLHFAYLTLRLKFHNLRASISKNLLRI